MASSPPPPPPLPSEPPPPQAVRVRLRVARPTRAAPSFLRILAIVGRSFRVPPPRLARWACGAGGAVVGTVQGVGRLLRPGEADRVDDLLGEEHEDDQQRERR